MPKPGEKRTEYGQEWVWVTADVEREHWAATDGTRVQVFPAGDGIPDIQVYVPYGPKEVREMVVHFGFDEKGAFRYAAEERRNRAN